MSHKGYPTKDTGHERWPHFFHNLLGIWALLVALVVVAFGALAAALATKHANANDSYKEAAYSAQFWQQVDGTRPYSKDEVGAFARMIHTDLAQAKGTSLPRSITRAKIPDGRYPYVAYEARYPFFGWSNAENCGNEDSCAYNESGKFGADFLNDLGRFQSHDPGQISELTAIGVSKPVYPSFFLEWPFYLWVLLILSISTVAFGLVGWHNLFEYEWEADWRHWDTYRSQKYATLALTPILLPYVLALNYDTMKLPIIGKILSDRRYQREITEAAARNPLSAELIAAERHLAEIQKLPHQAHPDVAQARQAAIATVEALRGVEVRLSEDEAAISAGGHMLALADLFERAKLVHETQDELLAAHHETRLKEAQTLFQKALGKGKE